MDIDGKKTATESEVCGKKTATESEVCGKKTATESEVCGKIHSIETGGMLDGPGIRTVFFLQGCNMRCKFCHNPDTWNTGAASKIMTAQEVANFAARYKNYYGADGGVTLSGGEPLLQQDFCLEVMRLLHGSGIRVAIDTGGSVFAPKVLDVADLVILDFKHTNADDFKRLTGVDNVNFIKTLEYIKANGINFWARQVIVPGYTDDDEQVKMFKYMARGASNIELLPYHTLGVLKWRSLELEYSLQDVNPPTPQRMQQLNNIINND